MSDWHKKHTDNQSKGVKFALQFVAAMGTIQFVAIFNIIVFVWIVFNTWAIFIEHWDPYPFILLNLFFSWQASNAASFILIAQNDQAKRDKIQAQHQYEHQEKELELNTKLTKEIHDFTSEIRGKLEK